MVLLSERLVYTWYSSFLQRLLDLQGGNAPSLPVYSPLHMKSHLFLLQRKIISPSSPGYSLILLVCLPFSSKMPEPRSLQPTSLSSLSSSLGDSHGEGNGTPLQYSCLENPMDGGAWWAAVHGVGESRTRLSDFTFTFHFHPLEKEIATHSSVLAWRTQGRGSLVGCRLWGRTESDTTEAT